MKVPCLISNLLVLVTLLRVADAQSEEYMNLDSGWLFRQANTETWYPARVPGCVHTDLLQNRLIDDPYFRTNESDIQWIGEQDWEYSTDFSVPEKYFGYDHIELYFHGLDTYSSVYFNDNLILESDNMFRSWCVDVKPILRKSNNTLRILFHSVFKKNLPKWQQAPFRLMAYDNNDQAEIKLNMYSRKAGFHYGWDWGPRLITCGIWRPVQVRAWSNVQLQDLYIQQNTLNDNKAKLTAQFQLLVDRNASFNLQILVDGVPLAQKKVNLKPGLQTIALDFVIKQPKRWWCNGLGEPHLYRITGVLRQSQTEQKIEHHIGLRTLRIVREEDKFGRSLYVELNGLPVFMKGANYIPQDNFQNRVTTERYEHIIRSAAEANMNMLRVWGGGIYQDDLFYDLCDRYGILLWHDLMFSCAMYPADEDFLANVKEEVRQNVIRLRNHPCIAIWCGNNEVDISWYGWGWKSLYPPEVQKKYEADLHQLFRVTIPEVLQNVDPLRYYHPTSPNAGYNDISYGEGDIHYWGVWHGKEPFTHFEKHVARFVSEYGFQSYPQMATIESFTLPEDRDLHSPVMLAHQRCMADGRRDKEYGNRLIQTYMEQHYRLPKNFADYLYLSQVLQAEGVKMAIEIHRRHKPYCMGTLFWQIDDCWPVASWSSIDYYGRWKALHYFARKAYAPILISPVVKGDSLSVYLVSDEPTPRKARLILTSMDFRGRVIEEKTYPFDLPANSAALVFSGHVSQWLKDHDHREVCLQAILKAGENILVDAIQYFALPKDLHLTRPQIDCQVERRENGYRLFLKTDALAKNVYLSSTDADATFSDNYFDLLPGQTVVIDYRVKDAKVQLPQGLRIRSLWDTN